MNYDHFIQIIKFESVYTLPLLKYWLFTMLSFELVGYIEFLSNRTNKIMY